MLEVQPGWLGRLRWTRTRGPLKICFATPRPCASGRGVLYCYSLVFDDGFWRCHAFRARSGCCCFETEGRSEQTRSVALALGPETRMKSRRPARRPRGGLLRETLRLWRSQHLGRRPAGTRGTEHVFSLADVGGKSGKAQSKNSSLSPVRYDATPGEM